MDMAMTIDQMKDDFDWQQAFCYSPVPMNKVKRIVAYDNGANEDADWIGIFELEDGTYLFLAAGCDYTGWGCQDWGHGDVYASELLAIQGVGDQERDRLGLKMVY